jgi:hypothetical protein
MGIIRITHTLCGSKHVNFHNEMSEINNKYLLYLCVVTFIIKIILYY